LEGFDCSGLVVEVLKAVGILGPKEDLSAAGLYERFMEKSLFGPGRLVFWRNKKGEISHVEMMLDEWFVVGASGGNEEVTNEEKAAERNAYVKMRPVDYRGPVFAVRDPFKRG
jgi:cell wall-associated NlpC family hydrolase